MVIKLTIYFRFLNRSQLKLEVFSIWLNESKKNLKKWRQIAKKKPKFQHKETLCLTYPTPFLNIQVIYLHYK